MEILLIGLMLVLALAYANGANDVSKAVATLVGSGVTDYRTAILWGTIWTMLGAVTAAFWATAMLTTFTTGILKDQGATPVALGISIIAAAILWVLFASRRGLPVSTTHAILGGLCGSALALVGVSGVEWVPFLKKTALPLALSPVAAFAVAWALSPFLEGTLGRWSGYCLCVQPRTGTLLAVDPRGETRIIYQGSGGEIVADRPATCEQNGLSGLTIGMDSLHWLSSGVASFARGLNDAPKIVSLLLILQAGAGTPAAGFLFVLFVLIALAMGAGSYFGGRRVTEVLAERVTTLDHIEGLTANMTTTILVTATAVAGMPVSTTHVSGSAIIAAGVRKGRQAVRWSTVRDIVSAWLLTLPLAAFLGGSLAWLLYFLLP